MTDYEIQKIAKRQAVELVALMKADGALLDMIVPPRYMNIEEASEYTRIPVGTLRQKINEIPHSKKGKRIVFSDRALSRWLSGL